MAKEIFLSLVIPLFNEENRFPASFVKINDYLKQQGYSHEIILVNDGSTDQTENVVQEFTGSLSTVKIITYPRNRGKGYALKQGVLAAQGRFVFFTDIDLSVAISYLEPFLLKLKEGYPVVIGSRKLAQSEIASHQPWLRENMGNVFRKITQLFIVPGISDITCGFKGFDRRIAHNLFFPMTLERWGFDAELLFLARKYGFKVGEIPVTWSDSSATKVGLLRDSLRTIWELLEIGVNEWRGLYGKRGSSVESP